MGPARLTGAAYAISNCAITGAPPAPYLTLTPYLPWINAPNSTQPYTAVFQDDLIRTYRSFVDRRRSTRPVEEYREPTPEEWDEFEEHFALRRVELGSCARPYGSSCEHEHACIRCPVLRVDPAQLDRLEAIATSLQQRIAEADERGWAGEVEQLTISLRAAQDKILATAPPRDPTVLLGYPTLPRDR